MTNTEAVGARPPRILRLEGVSKSFGTVRALTAVSLSLSEGEVLGLIGPSGSGKTTLLRCLDLLETIDAGTIRFADACAVLASTDGLQIKHSDHRGLVEFNEPDASVIRRRMGYVFQEFNLWEDKSVMKNLILAPTVVGGLTRQDAEDRARLLCGEFGLSDKLAARPWQLSGGQRQRVALVRSLIMQPDLLLLDEITSALDPVLTFDVMQAVRKLREKNLSIIIVTHHLKFATSICDKIAFLAEGRLLQLDTPDKVRSAPATPEIERFLEVLGEAT